MKPVGQIIREARKKAGVTQKQLADMCGVVPSAICDYEHGVKDPPVSRLILIADKLNINLGVLSEPPKVRCPACGEPCRTIYRDSRYGYGGVIGCDNCITECDAAQDADANPKDYGLEANDE